MNAQIQPYLPNYVNLYFVDYNSNLCDSKELLQESVASNSLDSIHEKIWDWWDYPEGEYLKEIRQKMEQDGAEELYEENEEEIRDWLSANDTSTPVDDLLKNTGEISMFYSLGLEVDGWSKPGFMCPSVRYSSVAQDAYKIRRVLGIQKGTKEAELIESIVRNASYGGELRVYFSIDLEDVLSEETKNDFKQIRFKGKYAVAVYHSNGSGDFEYLELDKVFPFTRDNLYTSDSDKYSLESCFGMCGDWLDKSAAPVFSMNKLTKASKLTKSKNAARNAQDAEYKRIFKAGGCSAGDMDYTRHRDVYYDNNFPCGNRCPHCGTFWID